MYTNSIVGRTTADIAQDVAVSAAISPFFLKGMAGFQPDIADSGRSSLVPGRPGNAAPVSARGGGMRRQRWMRRGQRPAELLPLRRQFITAAEGSLRSNRGNRARPLICLGPTGKHLPGQMRASGRVVSSSSERALACRKDAQAVACVFTAERTRTPGPWRRATSRFRP
jgi:hypothetical protein